MAKAKAKQFKWVVSETSGLGHAFTNASMRVTAPTPEEAARKVTKCPTEMVAIKEITGVWDAYDLMSHNGWSGIEDPDQIKILDKMVELGFATKHSEKNYSPKNQWIVKVIKL